MLKFKEALFQNSDFAVFNKPSGFNTHAQDPTHPGFVEIAERFLLTKSSASSLTPQSYKVVHRLDRDTSGLILFAKNESTAKAFFDLFSNHQIQKTYLFVTDRNVEFERISVSGEIHESKQNKKAFQLLNPKKESSTRNILSHESWTDFEFIKQTEKFYIWKAKPKTGRPHQIRLHARFLNIPVLGDNLYEGSPYPRLMLHAESLHFTLQGESFQFQADFSEIQLLTENFLSPSFSLKLGLFQRERIFSREENDSLRICHQESSDFKMDRYGRVDWFYWYSENDFPLAWLERQTEEYSRAGRSLHFRRMTNRGAKFQGQQELWSHPEAPRNWVAEENGIKFSMKSDQGLSPGVFLDQRDQRQWVLDHAKGLKVLNLFAYTCGFSVCAAKAGADQVVSVDTSKKLLEWGKENFTLNELEPENYDFFAQDVFVYLKGAKKRNLKFDLIICDPPSFGRSQEGVWSITKDLPKLLSELSGLVSPFGQIMLTSNYEGWSEQKLQEVALAVLRGHGFKMIQSLRSGYDFEPAPHNSPLLKGVLLQKKG